MWCLEEQRSKIILYLASKGNLRSLQTRSRGPVTIILQNYCSSWKLGSGCAAFCASSTQRRWCPVFWVKSGLFGAKFLKLLIITNKFHRKTVCETESSGREMRYGALMITASVYRIWPLRFILDEKTWKEVIRRMNQQNTGIFPR